MFGCWKKVCRRYVWLSHSTWLNDECFIRNQTKDCCTLLCIQDVQAKLFYIQRFQWVPSERTLDPTHTDTNFHEFLSSSAHSHCGHYFKHLLCSLLAFAKKYSTLIVELIQAEFRFFEQFLGDFSEFFSFFFNECCIFTKNQHFCGWKINDLKWFDWCENLTNFPESRILWTFSYDCRRRIFHLSTVSYAA